MAAAVDQNVVAVFPFRLTGPSADVAWLREGAADLLNLALDELSGWRVVSARTLLARTRGFTDATPETEAARVARSVGAGQFILGTAVVVGSQLRARAELYAANSTRRLASVEARGTVADPAPVIDSLAAGLARVRLVTHAGAARRLLQEMATTSPRALRAYLEAERLGRQGQWTSAVDSLLAAISVDSSFGLAYYRLRVATTFGGDPAGRVQFQPIEVALRHADRLPRRQRDLLTAVSATIEGLGATALRLADDLGRLYPDDPEAAYEQGEAYFHLGLALGAPSERVLEAFERAIRLDSTFIDPYNHAVELRVMLGDPAGARLLAVRGAALAPNSRIHQAVLHAMRAIEGEEPARVIESAERVERALAPGQNVVGRAGYEIVRALTREPARDLTLAEPFFTAASTPRLPPDVRLGNLGYLIALRAAQGRFRDAWAALDTARAVDPSAPLLRRAAALLALVSRQPPGEAFAALRQVGDTTSDVLDLALLGLDALTARDSVRLESVVRRLEAADAPLRAYRAALAAGLRGLERLQRGDTAQARGLLQRAVGVLPYGVSGAARSTDLTAYLAVQLARLELAAGMLDAAKSRVDWATFVTGIVPWRADMEELRAQIAERQGDTATAVRAWRTVEALLRDSDPEVQPRVAAARAAIARLAH
ncbi:MAG: hypothetical protein Q8Q85_04330 [Gemmatimonadales bacterium]|nr:hypothetical protein [Gemmatimonadales bacterium]